jgi:hypothetical protein
MGQAIAKPDFEVTSHADALSIPDRPKTPTRLSKNDEAQKHEKTETLYQSANFVTVDNNLSQLKSQNNFLSRKDPIFGERRKMHHAYLVAAQNFSLPSPTLDEVFFTFHNSISTRTNMPATRHARRTSAASYKPYEHRSLDIHMLQASILDYIQQITDFTYQDEVDMTPVNLMVAIRLLVKCDLALETIESGLNVAAPGTKYQYYRAVFLDYQDIIQEQKDVLKLMADVSDETTQQAFNQLDDYIPEASPGSPPYSPTSPEYSPVVQSSLTMEYPDWQSDTTSESPKAFSDDDNDEPLVE